MKEREPDDPDAWRPAAWLQVVAVVLLIFVGAGVGFLLYRQKTAPGRVEAARPSRTVEVQSVEPTDFDVRIESFGEAIARSVMVLSPHVSGRVHWIAPELVEGGFLHGGAIAVRLESADAHAAVERRRVRVQELEAQRRQLDSTERTAEAELARAEAELERLLAESAVAVEQYLEVTGAEQAPPLVAMEPRIAAAEAEVAAERSDVQDAESRRDVLSAQVRAAELELEQAQRDLERTSIELPGTGEQVYRVLQRTVSLGETLSVGQKLARLYRVDEVEVRAPLTSRELAWLELGPEAGAPALLRAERGGEAREWPGRLTRLGGSIDERTRRIDGFVTVIDVGTTEDPASLLVPGTFVDVLLEGRTAPDVVPVSAAALRGPEEDRIWVVEDGILNVLPVSVVRRERDSVLLRGLTAPAQVVVSRLETATEGMEVRVLSEEDR